MTYNSITDPKNEKKKRLFKVLGVSFLVIGGVLFLIGILSFFVGMTSGTAPFLFYLCFPGIIFLGFGSTFARLGFMKQVNTYVASQTAPVTKDTLKYIVSNSADSLSTVSTALNAYEQVKCSSCGALNDKNAKFCSNCGTKLAKVCPNCQTVNDANATYCDNCGKHL